jgi:hypothetical protein
MRLPLSVITLYGGLSYVRYYLKPQDKDSKDRLMELTGAKGIAPLDSHLGLAGLPFKITPDAMLRIAYWAQNQLSFQRAEEAIYEIMHVRVNDDTVRMVSDYVGKVTFEHDCVKANEAYAMLNEGKLSYTKNRKGVLYILTDGAAVNTRLQDDAGSTWRENKLGEVFSSRDIYSWTDKKGQRQHRLQNREYVSYLGAASEFQKHLLYCALRGGYGEFEETVVLSDGATWIRNMVEELFPDAQQILDFFHLCENVHTYAKSLFNMDASKYMPWAKRICDILKASGYRLVLQELEPTKDNTPSGCAVNLYGYITNNIKNIDYAQYEKKGYFIGSGAIESGNKLIVQDRLKRAGMRWNNYTAQYMLTLRTKVESNLWRADVENPFLAHCSRVSSNF